jgi:peptidoglycan/LPS O-acetylase OafA/YrhL
MSSNNWIRRKGHLTVLDGVRGIAISCVLIVHFYQREWVTAASPAIARLTSRVAGAGAYGVELFFVLSGFLITGILLDTKGDPGALKTFYARRILRIFPLYYSALIICFLLVPRLVQLDAAGQRILESRYWLLTYLSNLPQLTTDWDASRTFMFGHFWSLCVEEHFYLLWPLLVLTIARRRLAAVCLGLLLIGTGSRVLQATLQDQASQWAYWTTLTRIDGLAVGAFIAIARRDESFARFLPTGRTFNALGSAFLVLFAGLLMVPSRADVAVVKILGETVVVGLSAAVILMALRTRPSDTLHRVLSSTVLVSLGKYSYGLYVIHGILRPLLATVFDFMNWCNGACESWGVALAMAYYVPCIMVCYLLAIASYHLLESPFLSLKTRFRYATTSPLQVAVPRS